MDGIGILMLSMYRRNSSMNLQTEIITVDEDGSIHPSALKKAGHLLRENKLVAFPTETVYGLGANALEEEAVAKIYEAKGRPSDNPLIMHISRKEWLKDYVKDYPAYVERLMEKFWPGPLTLVFNKKPIVPMAITGGLNTVAIRMPEHTLARAIIEEAGVPIAAPSANRSGRPSPTTGRHVIADLEGRVDMIIDGGPSRVGIESTVLDVTGDCPCILRPGEITATMIEDTVGCVAIDTHLKDDKIAPKSPGMKYKHYAPQGDLHLLEGKEDAIVEWLREKLLEDAKQGIPSGVIVYEHMVEVFQGTYVVNIGRKEHPQEIAHNLFDSLRLMDEQGIEHIYALAPDSGELTEAIMNRMLKAAGNHLIKV